MGFSTRSWVDSGVITDSFPGFLFLHTDLKPIRSFCVDGMNLWLLCSGSPCQPKSLWMPKLGSTSMWWGHLRRPTKTKSKVSQSCHICTAAGEAMDLILLLGGGSRHSPSSMATSSTAISPSMPEPRIPSKTIWKEDVGLMLTLACLQRSPWFPLRVQTEVSWPVWLFCLKYTFNVPICFPYMW